MQILILGGGDVGLTLARYLRNDGWSVVLLNPEPSVIKRAERNDVTAHEVNITNVRELGEHEIEEAAVAIVVSDDDSANLLAAQLLRVTFGVEHIVIRVNGPLNYDSFEDLDFVRVCASSALAEALAETLDSSGYRLDRPPQPA